MRTVIPAILVYDPIEFRRRIRAVEGQVDLVQIDVTDGQFVHYDNFADPKDIRGIRTPIKYEIHLMTESPERLIPRWASIPNVSRIVFHIEATADPERVIRAIRKRKREVGLALNPTTPLSKIIPHIPLVDFVVVLGVTPGRSGQPFQPRALKKVRSLRRRYPHLMIEVDGGVNSQTAPGIFSAGASAVAAATAIFQTPDPPAANIRKLERYALMRRRH